MKHTFPKSERLHHRKRIHNLFLRGSFFYLYPFKVLHIADPNAEQHQVLVSIPRKNFKKAVTRNLIKRRVKEAYRLNKYLLADVTNTFPKVQIGYIYTAKEILPYQLIEAKLKKTLHRLIKVQASTLYSKKS